MPINRKLLGAAGFSLALAGGGVAGALLGTPNLSGAQGDAATISMVDHVPGEGVDGGRRGFDGGERGERLSVAAEALGISEADLLAALQDGQSIAQVAEAQGVDVQTVIDALVAHATERLNELEAALPDRMTELVNREGLPEHDGRGRGGHHRGEGLQAAADAIGITPEALRTELEGGSTIAEVAAAHDVEVQTVIDALVAEATARIDQAVADGRLDADRAEDIKASLVERITARVNGERPAHDDAPAPDDSPA